MPIPPIKISVQGDPTPSSPTVSSGDIVQWQADQDPRTGKYPKWYICFSPFKGHVIKTDPQTGLTPRLDAGQGIGLCNYKILSQDPTLVERKLKVKGKSNIYTSGGGIIIDN